MKAIRSISVSTILILIIITFSNCSKDKFNLDNPNINTVKSFDELKVPENFDFSSTREIQLSLKIDDETNPLGYKYVIEIYDQHPDESGNLILKNAADLNGNLSKKIIIPSHLTNLYSAIYVGNDRKYVDELQIINNEINKTIGEGPGIIEKNTFRSPPNCGTGCTKSYSGTTYKNITIYSNDVICIPENANFTGGVTFNGDGILKVCGNAEITYLSIKGNTEFSIIVGTNASFTIGNISMNNEDILIENYSSSFNVTSGTLSITGALKNYGTINISSINVNTKGVLFNYGTLNVSGNLNNNNDVENYGTINVSGHFNNNGGSKLKNNCKIITSGNFTQNDEFEHNGYLKVTGTCSLNGGTENKLGAGSFITTSNLTVNSDIEGPSSTTYAYIKVSSTTNINASGELKNKINLCDNTGIDNNNGTIGNDVTTDCTFYIPSTNCNPGYGSPPLADTDEDGVADINDDYPYDANRATNSYYPNENTFGTLAFEDLWPYKGDYDFNDLVLSYQYMVVENSDNKIVEMYAKYKILALGAGFRNGFGFAMPVSSSKISSVTGYNHLKNIVTLNSNGTESGHSNGSVIIVYDDITAIFKKSMINVFPDTGNVADADTTIIKITFTNPIDEIGTLPFNPFIFTRQTRNKEIHLKGYSPTDLASSSYFGTGDDVTNIESSKYYQTINNLPWAIDIPSGFEHMIEKQDIITGYLKFVDWAQSGGTLYSDWYLDKSGYRNTTFIYK